MSDPSHKTLNLLHAFMDKFQYLHTYILSTYLFWVPWMFTWRSTFEEDNGMVVQAATVMLFLSPIVLPFMLIIVPPFLILAQMMQADTLPGIGTILLGIGMILLLWLYYAFILFVSNWIIRYITKRLKKKITTPKVVLQNKFSRSNNYSPSKPKNPHLKALVDSYRPKSYFFKEEIDSGPRYVAWTSDLKQLKDLVYSVLQQFPEELDILLKVQRDDNSTTYNRFHGHVSKTILTDLIRENELYFFTDGMHQLCVKRTDTDEYFALDDHGILFMYSDSLIYEDLCREQKIPYKKEKLIYEISHWHYSPPDSDTIRENIIQKLSLKAVG